MADVTIEIRKNGPYRIHGDVNLVAPHGQFPILIKFLDATGHPPLIAAAAEPLAAP